MGVRESQHLIVPLKRGNQPEGPRRGKEVPSHEPLKGNMPGTLRPEPCPRNDDGSCGSRIHEMRNRVARHVHARICAGLGWATTQVYPARITPLPEPGWPGRQCSPDKIRSTCSPARIGWPRSGTHRSGYRCPRADPDNLAARVEDRGPRIAMVREQGSIIPLDRDRPWEPAITEVVGDWPDGGRHVGDCPTSQARGPAYFEDLVSYRGDGAPIRRG